jgi:hypothetical protein
MGGDPGRERVDGEVAGVEGLYVPGVPLLQPLGYVLDDRHQCDQLRRQQQNGGEDEDERGVEAVIPARVNREQLRGAGAGRERRERQPAAVLAGDGPQAGRAEHGGRCDADEEHARRGGQGKPPRVAGAESRRALGDARHAWTAADGAAPVPAPAAPPGVGIASPARAPTATATTASLRRNRLLLARAVPEIRMR